MREKTIEPKFPLCNIQKGIKKFILGYCNLINPVRIMKYYAEDIRKNRVFYVLTVGVIILAALRWIGFMDYDISKWIFSIPDSSFIGGTDLATRLEIPTGAGSLFLEAGKTIYDLIEPIGVSLAVLYWLTGLPKVSIRSDLNVTILFQYIAKLIVPIFFITSGWTILTMMLNLGNALLASIGSMFPVTDNVSDIPSDKVEIWKMVLILLPLMILWILGLAARIVAIMSCFTRQIKICVFCGFMPVLLADFANESHHQAMRALKQLLAYAIQAAIIITTNYVGYKLMMASFNVPAGNTMTITRLMYLNNYDIFQVIGCLAISATTLGLYSQSESISRTLVGA